MLELTRLQLQDESWLDRLAEAVRAELSSQTESPDVLVNELAKQLDGLNRSVRRNLEMAEMAGPSRALADRLVELEKEIDLTDKKLEAARQRAEASHGLDPLAAERAAAGALVLLTTGSQQMALRQVIERVDLLRTADGIEGVVHFKLPGLGSAVVEFRL